MLSATVNDLIAGDDLVAYSKTIEPQAHDVLPRRDAADRAGEDVVEHQRRDGRAWPESPPIASLTMR